MKKGTKRKLRLAALALMVACLVPMLAGCDVGLTKMGYIDKEGNTVIEGLYQMAQPFHEGLAGVMLGRGDQVYWGFISTDNKAKVNLNLSEARPFYDGVAPVCKFGSKYNYWVFIDTNGEEVFDQEFADASVFVNGLAPVQDMDTEKYGYIDRQGQLVIPYQYDTASVFSETDDLAMFRVGGESLGRCGYIDREGNEVIEPAYFYAGTFNDGLAVVKESADMEVADWGMINTQGEMVLGGDFAECGNYAEGLAPVAIEKDGKTLWGFMDGEGNWAIEPQFAGALSFSEGLAGVQSTEGDQLWGYIDKTGAWVIEPAFEGVADFSEGLAAVHGGKLVVAK